MSSFQYHQFLYGADNYGVLMHDPKTGQTAAIDAGDLDSYLQAITETGWSLSHILVTHHHPDHTDGLISLPSRRGQQYLAPLVIGLFISASKPICLMVIILTLQAIQLRSLPPLAIRWIC